MYSEAELERLHQVYNAVKEHAHEFGTDFELLEEYIDAGPGLLECALKWSAWINPDLPMGDFGGRCVYCHRVEPYTYHVPEALWRQVVPERWWKEIVCASCFDKFARSSHALRKLGTAFQFSKFVGQSQAPLDCDCYPGCWGDHSRTWSFLRFDNDQAACEAARLCHQTLGGDQRPGRLPHGSYVITGPDLRFANSVLMEAHAARLEVINRGLDPDAR